MRSKKMILVIPLHFDFYKMMVKALEKEGYEIVLCFVIDSPFHYTSFSQHLNSFIHKSFFDKNYKQKLRYNTDNDSLKQALKEVDDVDYVLVLRADLLREDVLDLLKEKSGQMVAYQWDGLKRFPAVFSTIPKFDRFYVFDEEDYSQYKYRYKNLYPSSNFYFNHSEAKPTTAHKQKVFFVGSYLENRMSDIATLVDYFNKRSYELDIRLFNVPSRVRNKYNYLPIQFIEESVCYDELIEVVKESEVVLDFDNSLFHLGLSFRVFEALFYEKKLVTNNWDVKKYDFYHPNNIFVWNSENLCDLGSFLHEPTSKIEQHIVQFYSFKTWINRLLHHSFIVNMNQSFLFEKNGA